MIQIKRRRLFSLALGAVIGWASRGWVTTAVANTIELAQAVSKLTKIGDIRDLRRSGFGTLPERARGSQYARRCLSQRSDGDGRGRRNAHSV